MRRLVIALSIALLLSWSNRVGAQSFFSDDNETAVSPASPASVATTGIFSRFALGADFSPLGIGATITTNLNPHMNLRANGSFFNYATSFSTDGFTANGSLKLASARTSLDVYPFHRGFRISPGVMLYNQNRLTASDTVASGTSFTLNGDTFYSANANAATGATPISGAALLNLHTSRPAFTITGGWGNPLAHGGHWSFPFEAGVGFVGAPSLNASLTGWACYDQAQTQCTNVTNLNNPIAAQVQSDLQSQISKWTQDLNPLRTYPIISGGVTYSFSLGAGRR